MSGCDDRLRPCRWFLWLEHICPDVVMFAPVWPRHVTWCLVFIHTMWSWHWMCPWGQRSAQCVHSVCFTGVAFQRTCLHLSRCIYSCMCVCASNQCHDFYWVLWKHTKRNYVIYDVLTIRCWHKRRCTADPETRSWPPRQDHCLDIWKEMCTIIVLLCSHVLFVLKLINLHIYTYFGFKLF
jgi:hypothetical protein